MLHVRLTAPVCAPACSAVEHTVYAAAHCWGAPIPDPRTPTMSVLAVSADGSAIRLVQQVEMPEGSLMPISQALNAAKTRLFTTAGTHGIVCFELDGEGKIVTTSAPVCSAITPVRRVFAHPSRPCLLSPSPL